MFDRMRRHIRMPGMALAGLVCAGLIACEDQPGLVIGAVLPMSGPAGGIGADIRDGLVLGLEDVNATGGPGGRTVMLLIEDGAGSPEAALSAYASVRSADRPPTVMVAGTSALSMTLKARAEADGQLLFGLVATVPELTRDARSVYRYWPTAEQELPVMTETLPTDVEHVNVVYLNDAYGTSVFDQVKARLSAQGTAVNGLSFEVSGTDFPALAAGAPAADAAIVVGFAGHIRAALAALAEAGHDGPVVSTTTATLPEVVSDPAADGVFVVAPAIYNPNYVFADEVRSRFEARFERPFNQYAANGYDFAVMIAGLLEGGEISAEALRDRLRDGFLYSGLFGNVSLDAGAQDLDFPLFPARISDGRLIYR